jgi:hypothetical protein
VASVVIGLQLMARDISFIAAFPKSGITFLNYMLFHVLFDAPHDVHRIDSDYIFDLHEHLGRVPPPGDTPRFVKLHASFGPGIPLHARAAGAVYLVRDPIDVMMSAWDFRHLMGDDGLLEAAEAEHEARFRAFAQRWLATGGLEYPWAGSWVQNVRSWLEQSAVPTLVVRYEQLKAQPLEQLRRILEFLGQSASDERVRAAVEAGNVENMRRQETKEVESRVSGAFYRPSLAKGYAHGYRFIGRLHQGAYAKVLRPSEQLEADKIFGPIVARVRERSQ